MGDLIVLLKTASRQSQVTELTGPMAEIIRYTNVSNDQADKNSFRKLRLRINLSVAFTLLQHCHKDRQSTIHYLRHHCQKNKKPMRFIYLQQNNSLSSGGKPYCSTNFTSLSAHGRPFEAFFSPHNSILKALTALVKLF
jgi:hypothetical protein